MVSELHGMTWTDDKAQKMQKKVLELDQADVLSSFRSQFHIPKLDGKECIYLCGNSLGLQPKNLKPLLEEELEVWADAGVEGHFDHAHGRPWLSVDEECCKLMSPIVGARHASEVAIMGSLSTNLHLLLAAFYKPTKDRFKILIEDKAFPSDYFIVESQIRWHGLNPEDALLVAKPREGEDEIRSEDLLRLIQEQGDTISVIMLAGVQFMTGQLFPLEHIVKAGHEKGCYVGFDLAHAAGNVPLYLHDWKVDFAAWCTYKYLNAGPGGIAGIFVHSDLNFADLHVLKGWWGTRKETRFEMAHNFDPMPSARAFQHSNPNVLAMTSLLASLRIFAQTDMESIRNKSFALVQLFRQLLSSVPKDQLEILTPTGKDQCGAQLSIRIPRVPIDEFMSRIRSEGIICDARRNQVIRIAFTGLYNTYSDVFSTARILIKYSQQ